MTAFLPRPGDLVGGKYRVLRLIGEGGMGVVYEARHEHLGNLVALKFLQPELAERSQLVARFLQEARVSASIRSPHVVQVVDVDQTADGAAYLVMELLEGQTLEERLQYEKPLPVFDAVDIGVQILSALEAAHARNIVHRDLKPDNVWLTPGLAGPHVKLLDFGIAKLKVSNEFQEVTTRPGSMMGTPAYMAPEQAISADQVDHRADLYSFGVILYEMLSGARPVDSDDPREILEHLVRGDVHTLASRNARIPPALGALVDRLVAPNPDARPANASIVRTELSRFARSSASSIASAVSGATPNGVVNTLPPADHAAPPFTSRGSDADVARASAALPSGKAKTEMMAAAPNLPSRAAPIATVSIPVHSAAQPQSYLSPAPNLRPPRRRTGLVITLLGVGAVLAGAGAWAYMNPSVFEDDVLPPMPGPMPNSPSQHAGADSGVTNIAPVLEPNTRRVVPPPPRVSPEPPVPGRRPPSPEGPPKAPTAAPNFPFPFPPIPSSFIPAIPSGLIPSSLPPFIPQIPGINFPGTAPPAPAPTAAPTATPTATAPPSRPSSLP